MKTKTTPKDWQEVKLKDICEKSSSNLTIESIKDNFGDYEVYSASGLLKKIDFYNEEDDYVGIVKDGSIGKVFYCEGKTSVIGTLQVLRNKENSVLKYLYYLLKNINFKYYKVGSSIPHIYFKDYSLKKVILPKSKKEQEKIAKILSCVDNVIDRTQEIIEVYERVKQGLMDELLVKGIGHKEFKKVKFGNREVEIPESWEFRELGEIFEILKSYGISRKHLSEKNEIKCFHYGDIHNFKKLFFDVGTEKISNCNYDFFGQKEIEFLKEGDVVLVDASEDNIDIGKTISIKNIGDFKCVAGLHTFLLRRKLKNIYIDYSVFLLNNKITKAEMGKISTGISVYGISKTNLKKLTSFIPPLPEQKTISKILQTQDNLIQLEKQSLTKLKQIKKGLMQKLLIGKTRVKI